ncbi:MAG: hypothetical protein LBV80_09520 [Deltaproteobacteria bacterium]|jgi:restriction system protein|nr:hypothetical protein [Deltaproteobacteria bacterium]
MAIPDFQSFMLPVLRLAARGPIRTTDTIAHLSDEFSLTEAERHELLGRIALLPYEGVVLG